MHLKGKKNLGRGFDELLSRLEKKRGKENLSKPKGGRGYFWVSSKVKGEKRSQTTPKRQRKEPQSIKQGRERG